MQHFTSFYADFGVVKQQNKIKKRFTTEWLGRKYPYITPKQISRYVDKAKPLSVKGEAASNVQAGRRVLTDIAENTSEIKDRTSSPVSSGRPRLEYVPNSYEKMDLISKANNKTVLNSLEGKDPKKLIANKKAIAPTLDTYSLEENFISPAEGKEIANRQLNYVRAVRKEFDEPTRFLPIHQSKNERLDFSPTRQQLDEIYAKNYEKDLRGANKYEPKLITGSANHTWLTADGQYMEVPLGQSEMPLNSNMWKGRISGKRLPAQEVKGLGEIGSPVRGISGSQLKGQKPMYDMSHKLVQTSDNYNSQIANKRYVPKE